MWDWGSATGSLATDPRAEVLAGEHSISAEKAGAMKRRQRITTAGHDCDGRIATGRLG
jgi:hypothetical protein